MYTHIQSKDEFISKFKFAKGITLSEFRKRVRICKNIQGDSSVVSLSDYVAKNSSHDREAKLPLYTKKLYKMLVEEPETLLGVWYREYGNLTHDIEYYFNFKDDDIFDGTTFNGTVNGKYGRLCRSANFDIAYNTMRTNNTNHTARNVLDVLRMMFDDLMISNILPTPVFFNNICNIEEVGYRDFWKQFMSFLGKPSILNPYTYRAALNELFTGGTLFAPCMSWNSCQVAFYNSHFNHFISTDVIPSVVENGRTLHQDWQSWNNSRSVLFPNEKTIDLYCCPSEQLQTRHGFIDKYRGKVDAVLFCPPYFDLELYDSPEQSVDSFPDYHDWLKGYWEETVKTCVKVMRPGARFGFIISNYYDSNKNLVDISGDMSTVAAKHLHLNNKYEVQWDKFSSKKKSHKMKMGNFEDLWLFEKR